MDRIYRIWLPLTLWALIIFALSAVPHLKSAFLADFILRKAAHVIEYGVLVFLIFRALRHTFRTSMLGLIIYPSLIALGYAILDEYHQTFVPGRQGKWEDVLIDAGGIAAFYLLYPLIRRMGAAPA